MLNRVFLAGLAAALLCSPFVERAEGQGRFPRGESEARAPNAPRWFASAGTGIHWGPYVVDDRSGSAWDFDAAFSLRGTVEREVAPRVSVGVAFNYARLPLTFRQLTGNGGCTRCAADATVSSYGGMVRYGGGRAFHQVLEGFVGALRYGNFSLASGTVPMATNTDLAFGAGVGFGYTLAPDWHVQFVQDGLYSVHERSTLEAGGSRFSRHYNTRLSLRVGF